MRSDMCTEGEVGAAMYGRMSERTTMLSLIGVEGQTECVGEGGGKEIDR